MFGRLSMACVMLLKSSIYVIRHSNIYTTINFTLYSINKINFIHYESILKSRCALPAGRQVPGNIFNFQSIINYELPIRLNRHLHYHSQNLIASQYRFAICPLPRIMLKLWQSIFNNLTNFMRDFFRSIDRQFNGFIINLAGGAVLLLFFAVLVVWSDFFLRLVFGCALLIAAWISFYAALKLYQIKRKIKDFIPRIK